MSDAGVHNNQLASALMRHVLPKLTSTTQIPDADWAGWDDLLEEVRINRRENPAHSAEIVGRAQNLLATVLQSTLANASALGSESQGADSQLAGLQLSQLLGSAAEDQVVLEQPTARITNKQTHNRGGRREVEYELTFDGFGGQSEWFPASKIRAQYPNGEALIQAYEAQQAALAAGAAQPHLSSSAAQAASDAAAAAAATMLPQVQPLQTAPPSDAPLPTDPVTLQRMLEATGAIVTSTGAVVTPSTGAVVHFNPQEGADGTGAGAAAGGEGSTVFMDIIQRLHGGKRPREEGPEGEVSPDERYRAKLIKQYHASLRGEAAPEHAGADANAAAAAAAAAGGVDPSLLPQMLLGAQQGGLSMPLAPGADAAAAAAAAAAAQQAQLPADPRDRVVRRCYDGIKWLLHNSEELQRKRRQQARRAELNQRRALQMPGTPGSTHMQQLLGGADSGNGSGGGGLTAPVPSLSGAAAADHKTLLLASLRKNLLPLVSHTPLLAAAMHEAGGDDAAAAAAAAAAMPAPLANLQPSSSPYWALPAPGRPMAAGGNSTPAIAELRNALPSLMPPSSMPGAPAAGAAGVPGVGVPELATLRQSLTGLVAGAASADGAVPIDAAAAGNAAAADAAAGGLDAGVAEAPVGPAAVVMGADGPTVVGAAEAGAGTQGAAATGGKGGDDNEAMIAAMSLARMSRPDGEEGEEGAAGGAASAAAGPAATPAVAESPGVVAATPQEGAMTAEDAHRWAQAQAAAIAAAAPSPTVQQLLGDTGVPGAPSVNEQIEALVRLSASGNMLSQHAASQRRSEQRYSGRGIQRLPPASAATAAAAGSSADGSPVGSQGAGMMAGGVAGGSAADMAAQHYALQQQQLAQMAAQQQLAMHLAAQQQLAAAQLPVIPLTDPNLSEAEKANFFARYPHLAPAGWVGPRADGQAGTSSQGAAAGSSQEGAGARGSEALQQSGMEAGGMPMMGMYVLPPHLRNLAGAVEAFPDVVQHGLADYGYLGTQALDPQQHAAILQQQIAAQQQAAMQQHHLQQLDPRAAGGMRRASQGSQQQGQQDMAGLMPASGLAFFTQAPSQPAM